MISDQMIYLLQRHKVICYYDMCGVTYQSLELKSELLNENEVDIAPKAAVPLYSTNTWPTLPSLAMLSLI